MVGVSRYFLGREGIISTVNYCDLSFSAVATVKQKHLNNGERLMAGHLDSRGIIVPRSRMRASIHRVEPFNTPVRRSVTVYRCVDSVDGPNSLWHIDGYYKLICSAWGYR